MQDNIPGLLPTDPDSLPFFHQRPMTGGRFEQQLGFIPQLLSLKYNGWMALIHLTSMRMFNRHGQPLSISDEFASVINTLSRHSIRIPHQLSDPAWLVCEALQRRHDIGRGSLFVIDYWDCLSTQDPHAGTHWKNSKGRYSAGTSKSSMHAPPFIERHERLRTFLPVHDWRDKPRENNVYLIDQFAASDERATDIWEEIPEVNERWGCEFYEGFVATHRNSQLKPQYNSNNKCSHIIKYRHDN